jgi:putative ABC transport system permease protein
MSFQTIPFALLSAIPAQDDAAAKTVSTFGRIWSAVTFLWAHRPETLGVCLLLIGLLALLTKVPLQYNVENLAVRWITAGLTLFVFTLVIGLLVMMLAFVNGMHQLTVTSGQPGNVIIMSDGSTDEAFSSLGMADVSDIENQPGILREGDRPLVSRETYLVANQPVENAPPGRPKRRFLQIRGVDDPALSAAVHGRKLIEGGRWFSEAGVGALPGAKETDAPAVEVILGAGIAREMGQDRQPKVLVRAKNRDRLDAGDTFSLNDRTWVVTGVFESSGSAYDSEIWAKQALVGRMFGKDNYTSLVARTAGPAEAQKLRDYFIEDYKKSKLAAVVETKYFENLSQTNQQFLFAAIIVAAFTALGGIFGVMNTMFAAISQRTKDIGVLRLLGFRRWQILVSFLLESLVLALIGGVIGCCWGWLLFDGVTVNSIVSSGQGGGKSVVLKTVVDLTIISSGMLLALLMGFLGGLVPSLSAMRLTALEALR